MMGKEHEKFSITRTEPTYKRTSFIKIPDFSHFQTHSGIGRFGLSETFRYLLLYVIPLDFTRLQSFAHPRVTHSFIIFLAINEDSTTFMAGERLLPTM